MEDYMEVFEYDNSELVDAWWNEQEEDYEWTGGEWDAERLEFESFEDMEIPQNADLVFDAILEILNGTQSYGTMGDYYNTTLGCYVFPSYEVFEYFIDIDAVGHEWSQTSDGHYVPLLYLDAYEGYRSGDGEEDEPEESAVVLPSEMETETLEVLESVRGLLSVIKENNAVFYDAVLEHQTEMLEVQEQTPVFLEGILYATIVNSVLLALTAGAFVSHVFFGRFGKT